MNKLNKENDDISGLTEEQVAYLSKLHKSIADIDAGNVVEIPAYIDTAEEFYNWVHKDS